MATNVKVSCELADSLNKLIDFLKLPKRKVKK